MELSYFPGCSLHSTAKEYDGSTRAVCEGLGIALHELKDWNCCGSTSAHSINRDLAWRLPLRNLEIAERSGLDMMVPCAACYGRSKTVESKLRATQASGEDASFFSGRVHVKHLLDVLAEPSVLETLTGKIKKPLTDLKAVCYYGCLTVRPPKVTGALHYEDPVSMDTIVDQIGATALPWSYKTDCCGASLTLTRADVVERLIDRLLEMAVEAGAECVVVACSMCHANLDTRQKEAAEIFEHTYRLPIFYISELVGLAMGHPDAPKWWKRHLTDPRPLLVAKGLM